MSATEGTNSRRRRVLLIAAPFVAGAVVGAGVLAGVGVTGPAQPSVAPVAPSAAVDERLPDDVPARRRDDLHARTAPASSTSRSRWRRPRRAAAALSPFTPGGSGSQQSQAEGTGYVYDKAGNIITADHVVEGATKITVRFKDGSTAKATLVGTDPSTDTAVIKVSVPSSKLTPLDARRQLHGRAG